MSTSGEQDFQSAKRQKANAAAQHKVGPPVTTQYAVKEAVADTGPVAAVAAVKDSVVAQLSLCQRACALSPGREYGPDDIAAIIRQLGSLFTQSTSSAHIAELQRALQLAAGDPSYQRYDEAAFVVTAWQGVTIADAVAHVLMLGHYTYQVNGAWRDDPTYQFQIVMCHEDDWRIEQLDAVSMFDGFPAASSGAAAEVDRTVPAVQPASLTSFDRQKTATAAIHYGACTTLACYWLFGNNGSDPNADYPSFANLSGGDDCTNFVSEMLAIGGLAQTSSNLAIEDPAAWYSQLETVQPPAGIPESVIFRAHSWTAVTLFWEYMSGQNNPHGRSIAYFTRNDPASNINDADLADVIVYDWGTTTQPDYSHVTLETGFGAPSDYGYTNSGGSADPGFYGDLISQHSPGRSNHPWNWGYISQHNALYRSRMRDRGWYVMHWGEHGTNGYPFLA